MATTTTDEEELQKLKTLLAMHSYQVGLANQGNLQDVLDEIMVQVLVWPHPFQLKAIQDIRWSSLADSLARTLKAIGALEIAFSKETLYKHRFRERFLPSAQQKLVLDIYR